MIATATLASPAAERQYKVFFANFGEQFANAVAVRQSTQEAARKVPNIVLFIADNQGRPEQTIVNADSAIAQRVDLYIGYNPPAVNETIARKMRDARIKVLAVQFRIGDAPLYAIDNKEIGRIGGDMLGKWGTDNWRGQPTVAVFHNYLQGGDALLERAKAAEDALKRHLPNIRITTLDTRVNAETTRSNMADFLTANPNVKVLAWVHLDDMAVAVKAAVEAANRSNDVRIVSVGGDAAIFPELRREASTVIGSVAIFPELWGADIIPLSLRILRGEQVPAITHPKIDILTRENINRYYPR